MIEDAELLRRYAADGSEAAFAELVARNLDLVYAAALRHGAEEHQARDIAQTVFVDLARKARALRSHPAVASWLFTSTRYAALKALRSERRRRIREREAHLMQHIASSGPTPDWERLRPVLDEVMDTLGASDREVVVLRYFRGLPFAELAGQLKVSEGALRMRVDRALGRMSTLLARRGISSTAAALGLALGSQPLVAAPAGLAASVSAAAVTTGAAGGLGTLFLMSKIKVALVSLVLCGGIATAIVKYHRSRPTQASAIPGKIVETEGRSSARSAGPAIGSDKSRASDADGAQADGIRQDMSDPTLFKKTLLSNTAEYIPELELLTDEMWALAASSAAEDLSIAFGNARDFGKVQFSRAVIEAIKRFGSMNDGRAPSSFGDIQPLFSRAINDDIIKRYSFLHSGAAMLDDRTPLIGETDERGFASDSTVRITARTPIVMKYGQAGSEIERAINRYQAQSGGRMPASIDDIRSQLKMPLTNEQIEDHLLLHHYPTSESEKNDRGRRYIGIRGK